MVLMKRKGLKIWGSCVAVVLFALVNMSGCGLLRSEFFRGETGYLYNQGLKAYKAGNFDKALEYFERATKKDPHYARALAGLGNVALIREEFDKAERYYRQTMDIEPGLKKEILPLLMAAKERKARQPLIECGVDLKKVFTLLSTNREKELEGLLATDVPLDLLARDTISLTLKELAELQKLIASHADRGRGSLRLRLFYGLFLFNSHQQDRLATKVMEEVAKDLSGEEQQEAYIKLGRLYERTARENKAISAYLKAVKAGRPMNEVAPLLADIYGVPVEEIIRVSTSQEQENAEGEPPMHSGPKVEATGLSSGTIGR